MLGCATSTTLLSVLIPRGSAPRVVAKLAESNDMLDASGSGRGDCIPRVGGPNCGIPKVPTMSIMDQVGL